MSSALLEGLAPSAKSSLTRADLRNLFTALTTTRQLVPGETISSATICLIGRNVFKVTVLTKNFPIDYNVARHILGKPDALGFQWPEVSVDIKPVTERDLLAAVDRAKTNVEVADAKRMLEFFRS